MKLRKKPRKGSLAVILVNIAFLVFVLACFGFRSAVRVNPDGSGEATLSMAMVDIKSVLAPYGVKGDRISGDMDKVKSAAAKEPGVRFAPYSEQQGARTGFVLSKSFAKIEDLPGAMAALTKAYGVGIGKPQETMASFPNVKLEVVPDSGKSQILKMSGKWDLAAFKELRDTWEKEKARGADQFDMTIWLSLLGEPAPADKAASRALAKAVYDAAFKDPPIALFSITLPGAIRSHNASSKDGNTLTWDLISGSGSIEAGFDFEPPKANADEEAERATVESIVGMTSKDLNDFLRANDYIKDPEAFAKAGTAFRFNLGAPDPLTEQQRKAGIIFASMASLASYVDPSGKPAFPSMYAVLPVASKLALMATKDPDALVALERLAVLLASMDMKA